MELITLQKNHHVFGFRLITFPIGIKEAFDALMKQVGDGDERIY
ncbi:hypothetical protein BH10BAC3_BH10BAC3_38340 [soil metagenome]